MKALEGARRQLCDSGGTNSSQHSQGQSMARSATGRAGGPELQCMQSSRTQMFFALATQDTFHFLQAFRTSLSQSQFASLACAHVRNTAGGALALRFVLLATPTPGWDPGKRLPLNLLCACRGSELCCLSSCCGQNCPVTKTKPLGTSPGCSIWRSGTRLLCTYS